MNNGRYIWSSEVSGVGKVSTGLREYFLSIYSKMCIALSVSGIVAVFVASFPPLFHLVYFTPLRWVVALSPIAMAFYLSCRMNSISVSTAKLCLWVYSGLIGASLSSMLYIHSGAVIARAFFLTAAVFFGMSLYGYSTKKDLSSIGSIAACGLIGVLLVSLLNVFMRDPAINWFISVAIVVCVTGLTAYDIQRLKSVYYELGDGESVEKVAVFGALTLYLDFVNLFVALLDIMGNRRDRW